MSRAWRKGSTSSWRRLRLVILDRDGWRCRVPDALGAECGQPATHVDHVTPRSHGGTDDPGNLRAACAPCNLQRGAGRPPRAARRQLDRPRAWSW